MLVDLTIQVIDNIRSPLLAESIIAVVGKLEPLLESKFLGLSRTIGRSLAKERSLLAQKWGNAAAKSWLTDNNFAVYLAVMHANK